MLGHKQNAVGTRAKRRRESAVLSMCREPGMVPFSGGTKTKVGNWAFLGGREAVMEISPGGEHVQERLARPRVVEGGLVAMGWR